MFVTESRLSVRRFLLAPLLFLMFFTLPGTTAADPASNDDIFPPAADATKSIDFDGRGFLIDGRRIFIVSGDLHYSRIPRAMWRDRLLRIKRAGYNTIQTYVFWSFHETKEGVYDFSGERDLNAYLRLIHSLGMYSILRIGPYVNSEWDSGGWPVWMRFKTGLVVRDENGPFYRAMDRWFDHLLPIVHAEQINRGGPVILVQLENEDPRGGGTDLPNPYFVHLRKKVVSDGLEVPYFFSGVNHSNDPAGSGPIQSAQRSSPFFSSEFWTGWIRLYGEDPARSARLTRATWKLIAYGGAGYDHYTMGGGSNFDHWACSEQGANYDFGAPIGQGGDLRDDYYSLKLAACFATSFEKILENADDDSARFQNAATGVSVTARSGPSGTILFLDNPGTVQASTYVAGPDGTVLPAGGPIKVGPGEFVPIVEHYPLAPGITLTLGATRILTVINDGQTTTLIAYGAPGDHGELLFNFSGHGPFVNSNSAYGRTGWTLVGRKASLNFTYLSSDPRIYALRANGRTVRVITETTEMAQRTWPISVNGKSLIVVGPDYVGEVGLDQGRLVLHTEERTPIPGPLPKAWLFTAAAGPQNLVTVPPASKVPYIPSLSSWKAAPGDTEAGSYFREAGWLKSNEPMPMGADGDAGYYAWYRTRVQVPKGGTYGVDLSDAGDWVSAFANGLHQDSSQVQQRYADPIPRWMQVNLHAGVNLLAFLTAHYGRAKLHAYIGPIDVLDRKGITGPVAIASHPGMILNVTQFREKDDDNGPNDVNVMTVPGINTDGPQWHDATIGTDVFNGRIGYAWFRTTLPSLPYPNRYVHFTAVDDNAIVFLNGKELVAHDGYNTSFEGSMDSAWVPDGPNYLAVLVQNTYGGGGVEGTVSVESRPTGEGPPIQGWSMHGGISMPDPESADWRQLLTQRQGDGSPEFYMATFTMPEPIDSGVHPVLRFSPAGLSRGVVYLNGHSLGRYPEMSPVDGLYFPDSYLKPGINRVVVFDEDGASPVNSKIVEEIAATRTDYLVVSHTAIFN